MTTIMLNLPLKKHQEREDNMWFTKKKNDRGFPYSERYWETTKRENS